MTAIKVQKTLFYSFKRHINAFAAVLYDYEAEEITKHPFTSLLCGTKQDSERIQSVRILTQDLDTGDYLDFLCAIAYNNTLVRLFAEDPQYMCCQGDANSITFSERR
ncbi:hypothetical protein Bca52824_057101 [Brassica carinata]|uniref:Uncharacterized protein n=1 Tax=Brassica carinata TaxID=52824 RepID=A0A8X7UEG6_BRACI|nr:PREDICTED: subtilisin-like protease SBT5.4 [Brassica oleracea var. oleracea]KAG2274546.1 hypothetical protein Bca52824_057101 [Brassica carinata]